MSRLPSLARMSLCHTLVLEIVVVITIAITISISISISISIIANITTIIIFVVLSIFSVVVIVTSTATLATVMIFICTIVDCDALLQTGYIDYDKLEEKALDFRPKMIICGGSAYPREWDYKRLRQIADKVGALLMSDMAHIRYASCMCPSDLQRRLGNE